MKRTAVVGGQHGDEGKGKVLSYLARKDKPEISVRVCGGTNAGHTVWLEGKKYAISLVPCAFVNEDTRLLIAPNVLVDPEILLKEIAELGVQSRIGVDPRATWVTAEHSKTDRDSEHSKKIGTTGRGMGPSMADRSARFAKTVAEVPGLQAYLRDVAEEANSTESVLIECTQGFMLSNIHGDYPNTTVMDVTASSAAMGAGLGPTKISEVIMVVKAITSKVGNGNLPGEVSAEEAEKLGFNERGTVTGRLRRLSPDLFHPGSLANLKRATMINGATQVALTKLDFKFPEAAGVRSFEKLSAAAKEFVARLEGELRVPATLIGTGPELVDIIDRREELAGSLRQSSTAEA